MTAALIAAIAPGHVRGGIPERREIRPDRGDALPGHRHIPREELSRVDVDDLPPVTRRSAGD